MRYHHEYEETPMIWSIKEGKSEVGIAFSKENADLIVEALNSLDKQNNDG